MLRATTSTMVTIQRVFESVQPARYAILNYMTATDISTFCHALKLPLTPKEKHVYLKPIRDLVEQEQWINDEINKGTKISIVGEHIPVWMMRIREPIKYWQMFREHITIRIWILAKIGSEEKHLIQLELNNAIQEMNRFVRAVTGESYMSEDDDAQEAWLFLEEPDYVPPGLEAVENADKFLSKKRTLREAMISYRSMTQCTFQPSGKFYDLYMPQFEHESSIPFLDRPCGNNSKYTWNMPIQSSSAPICLFYANINITRNEVLDWVPHSILDVDESGISTWAIHLFRNESVQQKLISSLETFENRSRKTCDFKIEILFMDGLYARYSHTFHFKIGSIMEINNS